MINERRVGDKEKKQKWGNVKHIPDERAPSNCCVACLSDRLHHVFVINVIILVFHSWLSTAFCSSDWVFGDVLKLLALFTRKTKIELRIKFIY